MGRRGRRYEGRRQAPVAHSAGPGLREGWLFDRHPAQLNPDLRRAIGSCKVARRQTKARRMPTIRGLCRRLRLNHFPAAQAGSADAYVLGSGSHPGMNRAQIDVPAPLTDIVGVADGISELRPLAADITNSCHNSEILPGLLPKP